MRYLIDGHNVIAQLPGININDPDDEAQLVMKLRGFCARTGKQVTVIFDGGIPGGFSPNLSNSQVTVRFASAEQTTADQILLNMIRRIKNIKALYHREFRSRNPGGGDCPGHGCPAHATIYPPIESPPHPQ
jgi:predicted RNA-binding protein with PIN domain